MQGDLTDYGTIIPERELTGNKGSTFTLKLIDDEVGFKEMADSWRELAHRADATVCMSFEWSWNWWKYFGRNKKRSLFIITVWDDSKLIAIAPLYKGRSTVAAFTVEERVQLIGSGGSFNEQFGFTDDYGISDFLDFIVDPEYFEDATQIFSSMFESGYLETDQLIFNQARDDSYILNYLVPALEGRKVSITKNITDTCPYIELNQKSLADYIKAQKSNARRRLRKTLRATGEENEFVIEEANSPEEIDDAIDNIISLHQDRWNEIGFTGVFYDQRFEQFFRDTVHYAHENGWLWFKQTRDKEGVCASRMLLKFNNRYYDYISGFDDNRDSAKYRPGIALLIDVVKNGLDEKARTVELLRGEEYYKYDFTSETFHNWKISVALPYNTSLLRKIAAYPLRGIAFLYKHIGRESRLIDVQRKKAGMMGMIPGYLSFRWQSVKMKYNW